MMRRTGLFKLNSAFVSLIVSEVCGYLLDKSGDLPFLFSLSFFSLFSWHHIFIIYVEQSIDM